jgi:hypothetical protein
LKARDITWELQPGKGIQVCKPWLTDARMYSSELCEAYHINIELFFKIIIPWSAQSHKVYAAIVIELFFTGCRYGNGSSTYTANIRRTGYCLIPYTLSRKNILWYWNEGNGAHKRVIMINNWSCVYLQTIWARGSIAVKELCFKPVRYPMRWFLTLHNPSGRTRPPRPVTGIALLYGDGVCFLWGTNWTVSTATSSQYLEVNCEPIV